MSRRWDLPSTRKPRVAAPTYAMEWLEARRMLSGEVLQVANPQDAIFDSSRGLLYVISGSGSIERYNLGLKEWIAPILVGGSLGFADITADGSTLFVTDRSLYGANARVHAVNLTTGNVTDIEYTRSFIEGGSWDVAIGSDQKAYVTSDSSGGSGGNYTGIVIDTMTGIVTRSTDWSGPARTYLSRSADRKWLAMGYTIDGLRTYSVEDDMVIASAAMSSTSSVGKIPAVSRDGNIFAELTTKYGLVATTNSLAAVHNIVGRYGGSVFDPIRDRLYYASGTSVAAFDTSTWEKLFEIPGINLSADLGVSIDDSGTQLAWVAGNQVQIVDLPSPDALPANLKIDGLPTFVATERPHDVVVQIVDAAGEVVTDYSGTLSFTSTDPRATVPVPYTFTPADAGTHVFQVTFRTPGSQEVFVRDGTGGLQATVSTTSHQIAAKINVPVTNRDMVYDSLRGLLYVATAFGTVERYDPRSQEFLVPILIGEPLNGIDITPDCSTLIVSNSYRSFTQGWLEKIDLSDNSVTHLRYDIELSRRDEGGAYDLTIPSSNIALFSADYNGSGNVPFRQLDLASDTISVRTGYGYGTIEMKTGLSRGYDRNLVFIAEGNSTAYKRGVYDALTDTFPVQLQGLDTNIAGSVNRNSTLIAAANSIFKSSLQPVRTLEFLAASVFDPTQDVLYGTAPSSLMAFDTNTWAKIYQVPPIDYLSVSGLVPGGAMVVSSDSRWLFVSTQTGFSVYPLMTRPVITSLPISVAPGGVANVIVTAKTLTEATDTNYSGTVRFECTDPLASLPSDYTFSPGDAGNRSFGITLNTPGRHTITVTDLGTGMVSALYDVMVTGVSLDGEGALYVVGGTGTSTVDISTSGPDLSVTFDGFGSQYDVSQVRRVEVFTQGGNDSVIIGGDGVAVGVVDLGTGNDTIDATARDDDSELHIFGGDGTDQAVLSAAGRQKFFFHGDAGGDSVRWTASSEDDTLVIDGGNVTGTREVFVDAESFIISGGAGNDTMTGSGFEYPIGYSIDGGDGNDEINVAEGGTGQPVVFRYSVTGGNGDDICTVSGTSYIWSYWTFNGGNGSDTLRLNASGSTTVPVTLSSSSVTQGTYINITYNATENLEVIGTNAGETFNVGVGSSGRTVLIDAGGGSDVFVVTANPSLLSVTLNGQAGDDKLTISASSAGKYSFDGGDGYDSVEFFVASGAISPSVLADRISDSMRQVFDQNLEAIIITGRTAADTFNIAPRIGATINIDGGAPVPPSTPGDTLVVDPNGAAELKLIPSVSGAGQVAASNRQTVTYANIETINDVFAPRILSADFSFEVFPQTIELALSEDPGNTLAADDLRVMNVLTGEILGAAWLSLVYLNGVAAFSLIGVLSDGNYRVTLPAGSIADTAGNPLAGDYTFDFFILAADANHDRTVNLYDLVILATNWQGTGKTFSQGDFNYDGVVNSSDLAILATHWQVKLDVPAPAAPPVPTSTRSPSRTPARTPTRVVDLVN